MIKPTINKAAIKAAEELYSSYIAGNLEDEATLLYVLLAICTIGLDKIDRYKDMFACVLNDYEQAEAFKSSYEIPSQLIYSAEWPEVLQVDSGIMDEETLLAKKKSDRIIAINKKRDLLIDSGFTYNGNQFQSKASDRENIMGVSIAAKMAIEAGAQPGNYRWADSNNDFVWITLDNNLVQMDAYDVIGLYQTGMQFKSSLTFKARQLKDDILVLTTSAEVIAYEEIW